MGANFSPWELHSFSFRDGDDILERNVSRPPPHGAGIKINTCTALSSRPRTYHSASGRFINNVVSEWRSWQTYSLTGHIVSSLGMLVTIECSAVCKTLSSCVPIKLYL